MSYRGSRFSPLGPPNRGRAPRRLAVMLVAVIVATVMPISAGAGDGDFIQAWRVGSGTIDEGRGIAVDADGNTIVVGDFTGTATLGPGPGAAELISAGGIDLFIGKFDPDGALLWAHRIGGTVDDHGDGVAVHTDGSIFVSGSFRSTVDFDPGPGTVERTPAGQGDAFVLKFDAGGAFVWVRHWGGTGADHARQVSLDSFGNPHVIGYFEATVDFDPGAGTTERTSAGGFDSFLLKLDTSGDFEWVQVVGGSELDDARGVAVDESGNVMITGRFAGSFDPGSGSLDLTSNGFRDIFISKFDADGTFVWARPFGGSSDTDEGFAVAATASGDIVVVGTFGGTVDFDPGPGTANRSGAGFTDIFVLRLDTAANLVWVQTFASTGVDLGHGVAIDDAGRIAVTGWFTNTVDFDPGAGTVNRTGAGSTDAFVLKLNGDGSFIWVAAIGSTGVDEGRAVAAGPSGSVHVAGTFEGTVDFDAGAATMELTSAGAKDAFVLFLEGPDTDGDGIPDGVDNCPSIANADQADMDDDDIGDVCDDSDGDGFTDAEDNFPLIYSKCRDSQATIIGTEAGETINGTEGPDVIMGFGGDDTIYGHGGNDLICAGAGHDTVYGGDGRDKIYGENGHDTLYGEQGSDWLYGGNGNDNLQGGKGTRDKLFGGAGTNLLNGGLGTNDQCTLGPTFKNCEVIF